MVALVSKGADVSVEGDASIKQHDSQYQWSLKSVLSHVLGRCDTEVSIF